MKQIKRSIKEFLINNDSGQMLLFVMVILLLLMIIVLAIITNVKVDIKETQMEREYERGYALAEEELFEITASGYEEADYDSLSTEEVSKFCPDNSTCIGGAWDCSKKTKIGDEGEGAVIVKRCEHHSINDMTIEKDQTLEAYVRGADGVLSLSWNGAPAMSIMLVCKRGDDYTNVRASVCNSNAPTCSMSGVSGFISLTDAADHTSKHDAPLDMEMNHGCPAGYSPELLRLRAIGSQATAVTLTGDDLPPQMEEVRVQSFTEGLDDAEGLSAPEVVTYKMIRKRLPSIFDYVLFVANGDVSK